MADEAWDGLPHWEKDPEVAEVFITYLDKNVENALPSGSIFLEMSSHGASFWTRTARILTEGETGLKSFFLKVSIGNAGKGMMNGEFESMKALHATLPEMVPRPISWGTYESDSEIHFFLSDFHELDDQLCSLDTFPRLIAEVHSRRTSPDGKFGFPVTTYQGRLPQDPTPCDTWEECFTRNIDIMFEHELAAQGYDEEFAQLRETLMAKVVPRLLRPMETAGRAVVPRLVHGDLWEGNAGTDLDTGVPKIFDACSLYAHNEYEMAPWRPVRQKMGKPYVKAYLKYFPVSEPAEDFDGRNMLYALRFNICSSALYPGNVNYRNLVRAEMRELIDRYGEGFEGWMAKQNVLAATQNATVRASVPSDRRSHRSEIERSDAGVRPRGEVPVVGSGAD